MKISTRGRYALRIMMDIANNCEKGAVPVKEIALREGISAKYLEQIISALTKAGYLESVRGPHGGYLLTKDTEQYLVGDILRLTEGDLSPVACASEDYDCPMIDDCVTVRLWREVYEAVSSVIDKYTLKDLLSWQYGMANQPHL